MNDPWMRYAASLGLATSIVLGVARSAEADSKVVVLARPPTDRAIDTEVVNRVRGELLADGFSVQWTDATPDEDRVATLVRVGHAAGSTVAAGLWLVEGANTVELVLVDELTGRSVTRRLPAQPYSDGQAPEIIARRSVDFLRASMLDFVVESLRSVVSRSRGPLPFAPNGEASVETEGGRWAIEAGVGVLGSFQGVGPAAMPLARVRFAASPAWQLRITGAWLGSQPLVEAPTGTASVEQGLALFECTLHFWRNRFIHPFVSFGAGAYSVRVVASADPPNRATRSTALSFAADAGLGMASAMGSHFEVSIEAQTIVAEPGIEIRFLDVDSARIGRPSVLGILSIAGWI